jgi:hypothetical protein
MYVFPAATHQMALWTCGDHSPWTVGWVQVVGLTLAEITLLRLSSPSSFHLVWTGLKPSIGRFRDASWTLRLDGKQICPVRGQPRDGSQATKFWTTNGRPEVRPLVVRRDPWCMYLVFHINTAPYQEIWFFPLGEFSFIYSCHILGFTENKAYYLSSTHGVMTSKFWVLLSAVFSKQLITKKTSGAAAKQESRMHRFQSDLSLDRLQV